VRLVGDDMRCYDEVCDERFGRRTDEGFVLFLPGWIYQGEIWRDKPLEESWQADGGDVEDLWRMHDRMREQAPWRRNEPDARLKFVSSSLPASVQCPKCHYLQTADPSTLFAGEARTSLAKGPSPLRRIGRRLRHPLG
jgi:hypothetical protein